MAGKPATVRYVTGAHYIEAGHGLLFVVGTILKNHLRQDRRKASQTRNDLVELADFLLRQTNNDKDQVLFLLVKGKKQ